MQLNDPKTIKAWCMFDWANSAYALVISATIFPPYYNQATRAAFGSDMIDFMGFHVSNTVVYAYALATSFLIMSILSPILSGMADYSGLKMPFMKFFTAMGSLACASLFFFQFGKSDIEWGVFAIVLASLGFTGSQVFYNAFLPEVATSENYDSVSAKGFSYGYVGSLILLTINLAMVLFPQTFGLSDVGMASKVSFLMVGLWWYGFSIITFKGLKEEKKNKIPVNSQILMKGFGEIGKVIQELKGRKEMIFFLLAFFSFNSGVQTILYSASSFAEKIIGMGQTELIILIILLQAVAIGGAYLASYISSKAGNIATLMGMMVIWTFVCYGVYTVNQDLNLGSLIITKKLQFYFLATLVGMVMGGVQSLARSTYSKLLPENANENTSYFSFYDILYQLSIVMGMFSFGYAEYLLGSMRNGMISMAVFFILGGVFLLGVKMPKKNLSVN